MTFSTALSKAIIVNYRGLRPNSNCKVVKGFFFFFGTAL